MRDLRMRMEQIRKQISRYRSRHEKRLMAGLAAVCTVLSGGIGILLGLKQGPGIFTIQTEYGIPQMREIQNQERKNLYLEN